MSDCRCNAAEIVNSFALLEGSFGSIGSWQTWTRKSSFRCQGWGSDAQAEIYKPGVKLWQKCACATVTDLTGCNPCELGARNEVVEHAFHIPYAVEVLLSQLIVGPTATVFNQ